MTENLAKSREAFLRTCRKFYYELIDIDSSPADTSSISQPLIEHGKFRRTFSDFIKPLFIKEFGVEGRLLGDMPEIEFKRHMETLKKEIKSKFPILEGNLGDYSPWLKNFKRNPAKDLEIPGQYTGKSKPMPEYHVKIESFDERVRINFKLN